MAQSALLPGLVRTPSELTAANVASSTVESIGTFGPALGGLLLAVSSAQVVFAANAAYVSLVGRARLRVRGQEEPHDRAETPDAAEDGARGAQGS